MNTKCIYLVLVLALLLSCKNTDPSNSNQGEKITYDVVFRDDVAGKYEKWKTGEDSFEYYYTFTDRGRGPEYTEKITLDENGFIKKQSIEGVNYRKVPIDESFSGTESSASWSNPKETKQGDFYGSELYFRFDGSPAVYEILAQLLLNSKNGKIGLYPVGEAELVKTSVETLSDSTALDLLMIKAFGHEP